jgi:hypothetical protein
MSEIKFNIDDSGNPVIDIRHLDKSDKLEDRLLGVFIKNAVRYGLQIQNPSGFIESGTENSWENYRIRANK